MNRSTKLAIAALGAALIGAGCVREDHNGAFTGKNPPTAVAPQRIGIAGGAGPETRRPEGEKGAPDVGVPDAGPPDAGAPDVGPPRGAEDARRQDRPGAPPPAKVNRDGVPQQRAFEIDGAGQDGWRPARLTPQQLGERIDRALLSLRGAEADARMDVENERLRGRMNLEIRVASPEAFRVEYVLVSDPTVTHFTVADGNKRARFERGAWSAAAAADAPGTGAPADATIATWGDRFAGDALRTLTERRPTWAPMLSALGRGERGFRTVIETKTMPVAGQPRPFYRVLAERPGPEKVRYEMRFDGTRFVPLTMRVHRERANQPPIRAQWSAGWRFGRTVDQSLFDVPGSP
jgi:hypothetical protein